MIQGLKTTRTNFVYRSGHVRIEKEDVRLSRRLIYADEPFTTRKSLRKLMYTYKDSGLVITVIFDEPNTKTNQPTEE